MHQQDNAAEAVVNQKKKTENQILHSYIKRPKHGTKIVRLEIYDVDKIDNIQSRVFCECNAEVCMQYVVDNDNMYFDEIYNAVKSLMSKIQNSMEKL